MKDPRTPIEVLQQKYASMFPSSVTTPTAESLQKKELIRKALATAISKREPQKIIHWKRHLHCKYETLMSVADEFHLRAAFIQSRYHPRRLTKQKDQR